MISVRKLIHGSGLRVAGLVANTLIGFLLMPFLVHHLGDRNYGFWSLAGAILGYYGILDFGIVSAVQFYVAKALGEKDVDYANRAISTSFFTFAAIGSLLLIVTIILASLAHFFVKDASQVTVFRLVLLIMGVGFALGFPGRAFMGAMCAHMRWDVVSQFGLAALLLRAGLIFVAITKGGGLISLAAITVSTDVLVYLGYYLVLRKIQRPFILSPSLASVATFRQIIGYSAFTFVVRVSDQLRFYVDGFVVGAFVALGAVTHYAIASRLAITFMDLMIAILGLLSPWFSHLLGSNDRQQIKRVFLFGTKVSVFIATIVASLLAIYGRPFIRAWMGSDYLDAFWPLLLLTSAIFMDVSQLPSVSYLYGVYRHKFLAYATLVEGIANSVLSIYLARRYGIMGVAMGTAIPMIIMKLFVQPAYVCRHVGLNLQEYYVGILGRTSVFTCLSVIVPAFFLFNAVSQPGLLMIAALVTTQVLIATTAGYFTVFGKEERQAILSSLFQACRWRVEEPVHVAVQS
jgi:O-antigen/teichoic acid export membrane protein